MQATRRSIEVTFITAHGATVCVTAAAGDTLLDAALESGIALEHECGGNCSCTTCRVEIEEGAVSLSVMEWPEDDMLRSLDDRTPRSRLACQALLTGDSVVARIRGE